MFCKVNPEADAYLGQRSYQTITRSIVHNCAPDALCVSGSSAGSETDTAFLREIGSYAGGVPVICNTGCNAENVTEKLKYCDGVCVGSAFKKDGKTENTVDPDRVKRFMDVVRTFRENLH